MATVTLPFGYPLIEGQTFETIIYQGNLVRVYTLPKDPRTDSQLFQRRFLADVLKMRATLGAWGKGAMKIALGSKWGTVLYQLIKADDSGRWSEAVAAWDAGSEGERDQWRDIAPFKATFNDCGKVFYCLAYMVGKVLYDYTGAHWESEAYNLSQAEDASTFWTLDLSGLIPVGDATYSTLGFYEFGSWFNGGGGRLCISVPGVRLYFYYKGKGVVIHGSSSVGYARYDVFHDGQFVETVIPGTTPQAWNFAREKRGMHLFEIRHNSVEIYNRSIQYEKFTVYA